MKNKTFTVISDLKEAESLWNKFTPRKRPYDEWGFRSAFYNPTGFPLYFQVGYVDNEPIGVLPLQKNTEKNFLEFFGGSFMEYNHVLIHPDHKNEVLDFYLELQNSSQHLMLRDLTDGSNSLEGYEKYDSTFTLKLAQFKYLESFLGQRFSSKSRNSLKKKIKKIEENEIKIIENNFEDVDLLIDLNRKRFGAESSFEDVHQRDTFHHLLNLPWNWIMQTFIVNGSKEAVSLSLHYQNIFMYIMAGSNLEKVPNIGTYVVVKTLEKAFNLKAEIFDAGRNPSGWKDRWHLEATPVYRVVKNSEALEL